MDQNIAFCLICGSAQLRKLTGYEKDHLVACKGCSFVFSNRRPSKEELDTVYGGYSREVSRTRATLLKMEKTALWLKSISNAKRVIDIGCGDGEFLRIFKELGCEVFGTEYDKKTEDICRGKGIIMLPGGVKPSMGDGQVPGSFDLALLTEVIEHINNPVDVIEHLACVLKRGGLLYVTTPNFAGIERRILGAQWCMFAYPEHISYYSPTTLDLVLRNCGFEKVFIRTENISVFRMIQFLNRRKESAGMSAQRDPEQVSAAAQNAVQNSKILSLAKSMVNAMLNCTGTGTSLTAAYRLIGK